VSSKNAVVKRQASSSPCQMSHKQLRYGYFSARSKGDDCYIAAEFPSVERGQMFIVGDNKTYGGFYNAPLQRADNTYRVWFGIFVTVDGVSFHICSVLYAYSIMHIVLRKQHFTKYHMGVKICSSIFLLCSTDFSLFSGVNSLLWLSVAFYYVLI